MNWLLLIFAWNASVYTSFEFQNKEGCESAKKWVEQSSYYWVSGKCMENDQ